MYAALFATSRRQSAAVGQKRPYTSLGGRFECSGRGHGRIQPFLHWSETAATHATSSLCGVCGAMWYGVVALRERRRATALGRHIESNESNQRIRSARKAVPAHLSNRIFTAHTNLPVFLLPGTNLQSVSNDALTKFKGLHRVADEKLHLFHTQVRYLVRPKWRSFAH